MVGKRVVGKRGTSHNDEDDDDDVEEEEDGAYDIYI